MKDVAENTKNNEPGVLTYSINRSLRPNKDGTEEIVMIEKCVASMPPNETLLRWNRERQTES